ncbi:hypothetical protein [Mucilaginibacter ginkgonis]|uniref:Uncharacterized protein n=1 Tax=Mucilaginibacter ginkgonis TaxID=2682091 RepID=A0A6I4HY90_9SPHI|nr:hypothetical protein [Mucilaginibacter ginkgonis]QQL49465.1 hypothetical protein GO620_015020 [Mucilaginibacter ginkgonis]
MKTISQQNLNICALTAVFGSILIDSTIRFWTYTAIFIAMLLILFVIKRFNKRPADIKTSSETK